MTEYEKRGYLNQNFMLFHPIDHTPREFSFHYHDFCKILILLKGNITYCIEGKTYELAPYDIVLVNEGEVHRPIFSGTDQYERIILYISTEYLRSHRHPDCDLGLCFLRAQQEQTNLLRLPSMKNSLLYQKLLELEASMNDTEYAAAFYRDLLFWEFMVHLNRAVANNTLSFMTTANSDNKILTILSYINEHLTEDLSADFLAKHFFISKYYMMHSFKKETGYTIGEYISMKRLRYAKELIQGGMAATEACLECGFKNYSSFFRAYKKFFQDTPISQKKKMPHS